MAASSHAARHAVPVRSTRFRHLLPMTALAAALGCADTPAADPLSPENPGGETPDVTPGHSFSTGAYDIALWVAVHPSGVYVTGYTGADLDGPHVGGQDLFVRKYHPEGQVLWADQFGSTSDETPFEIVVDSAGNAYIAGNTSGSLAGSRGNQDGFVRKYDANGTHQWTRQFGTTELENLYGAALAPDGSVVVVGSTAGSLQSPNSGATEAYLRMYSASGEVVWTRQFGRGESTEAAGVAVAQDGSIYVVGATFGDLQGTNDGEGDAFLRKYSPAGAIAWTRQFGTAAHDVALRVRLDNFGNVIVSGSTRGSLRGTNAGGGDVFVRKYSSAGLVINTRQFGSTGDDVAFGLAVDETGSYFIGGYANGDIAGAVGGNDAFVRKYSSGDAHVWTRQWGTLVGEELYGIAVSPTTNLFVAGGTNGALVGANQGSSDAFLSRLNAQGIVEWTDQ